MTITMETEQTEVPPFELKHNSLGNRCKNVFGCLDALESRHQAFERTRALEDADEDERLVRQGPSQADMETISPAFRAPLPTRGKQHQSKQGGRHSHERVGYNSDFKQPVCLARALGFPKDLFKENVTDEISYEDNGLPVKELRKMLDYNMLYKALHLSLNNHSADWNCCVIKQALTILDKQGLTFEDIYNARLAYQAYEAADMKGMWIEKHTILRTLKMCGKTISPMKLMHRVKHSKDSFEEAGRMQLYEFLDLILWANEYEPYEPQKTYGHFEMENEMFKLVDFDDLLSHHDQRLANALDKQYLEEERTFSQEKHGEKGKFKEPPVACSDSRVEMAREQKKTYQGLKTEVVSSQKSLYYSQQGFVRPRPLTAPNLSKYKPMDADEKRRMSLAVQNALQNKYQKLLRKAYRSKDKPAGVDLSDKPILEDLKRCETPKIVTESDLKETKDDFQNLMFNHETEWARYAIKMDTEMDFYIPDFKEKWMEKKENAINPREMVLRKTWQENIHKYRSSWLKEPVCVEKPSDDKTGRYDNDDIINHLAYPVNRLPPSHAKKCDARFRGWHDTRSKKGAHYILVSPYFHNSPKGRLMQKLAKMSDDEIKNLHGEFLFRYTKKNEVEKRPVTAPPKLAKDKSQDPRTPSSGYYSMDEKAARTTPKSRVQSVKDVPKRKPSPELTEEDKGNITEEFKGGHHTDQILEEIKVKLEKLGGKNERETEAVCQQDVDSRHETREVEKVEIKEDPLIDEEEEEKEAAEQRKADVIASRGSNTSSRDSVETSVSDSIRKLTDDKPKIKTRSKSAYVKRQDKLQNSDDVYVSAECRQPRSKSAMDRGNLMPSPADIPTPYMDHSKPKVVSVGSIGKISLLESISESKYWEDILLEEIARRKEEQNGNSYSSDSDSAYSDVDSNENFEHLKESRPKKRVKSKSEIDSESVILAMILKEEKQRKKKSRSNSSKTSRTPRSPLPKSPKSNRSASSTPSSKSIKSPISEKKMPEIIESELKLLNCTKEDLDESLKENIENKTEFSNENKEILKQADSDMKTNITSDEKVHTDTFANKRITNNYTDNSTTKSIFKSKPKQHVEKLDINDFPPKQKKVIIISSDSFRSSSTPKTPDRKYERLVNRMDGTLSKLLTRRLLSS